MSVRFLAGRRIVLAPMAGGPGTPALAAAVVAGGAAAVLPSGYVGVDQVAATIDQFEALTAAPYAVNLFVPADPDEARLRAAREYAEVARRWAREHGLPVGEPRYDDDAFAAKVDLLVARRSATAVTFTFGLPTEGVVGRLRAAGIESLVTVTTPGEARAAADLGVDGLVVQGAEAGSHRGGWLPDEGEPIVLLPLLALVREATDLPVLAAGGIATGEHVAAVLDAGAEAAVVGTAFLLSPQAGTSAAHRDALRREGPTVLTRAFTGKPARALPNAFTEVMADLAPDGFPEVHHVTAPMRAAARERGEPDAINLWAGDAYPEARAESADVLVRRLLRASGHRDDEQLGLLLRAQWETLRAWLEDVDAVGHRNVPTGLEGWDVGELLAHLGLGLRLLLAVEPAPPDADPLSFREYVAAYPPAAAAIADMTREVAVDIEGDVLGGLDGIAEQVWASLARLEGDVLLGRRGPVRRDDYLLTRLLELVVHADDLDRALGHPRAPHPARPEAVAAVAEVLAVAYEEAAGSPWLVEEPMAWIRRAAGRDPSPDEHLPLL